VRGEPQRVPARRNQIAHEEIIFRFELAAVRQTKKHGRVYGHHQPFRQSAFEQFPPVPEHAHIPAGQRLRGGRSHADHDVRPDHFQFRFEPRPACHDLHAAGLLVNPALTALLESKMLHGIGDVGFRATDTRVFERPIQDLSGRPDERPALPVFIIPRLLTDQKQPGASLSFAEYGLRGCFVQIAPLAFAGGRDQRWQCWLRGNPWFGALHSRSHEITIAPACAKRERYA
jgi:hypothetical protein